MEVSISNDTSVSVVSIRPQETFTYYLAIARVKHTEKIFLGDFSEPHVSLSWAGSKYCMISLYKRSLILQLLSILNTDCIGNLRDYILCQ